MIRTVSAAIFASATILVLWIDTSVSQQPPLNVKTVAKSSKTQRIIQLLNREIDMKQLQQAPVLNLEDFFNLLKTRLPETKGKLTIIVDRDRFRFEDPDAPDIMKTEISFRDAPQRMPLLSVLQSALASYPAGNATFFIRRGALFVTTEKRTLTQSLLAERVTACFVNHGFADALLELSDQSGAAIVLDRRIGAKINEPVTATFANNATLESALVTLCELTDLKMIPLGRVLFVTTPERAKSLRRLSQGLNRNLLRNMMPTPNFGLKGGLQLK